jgi:anti-anti-sigma regulatory factor
MALFSKLPVKKPGQSKADANARARGTSGANVGGPHNPEQRGAAEPGWRPAKQVTGGITITGFGLVEPSPTRRKIDVTHGNAGMCAVLENAVLLFASGHAEPARALLAEGIEADKDTRVSPLAWLTLFDLMQRAGDRSAFEQLALQYVVQFERSAPTWDDRVRPTTGPRAAPGGYVSVTGKLTGASAAQLDSLRRAITKNASQARFDLAAITEFDEAGARLLADVLGEARRRQYPLRLQRPESLKRALEAAVKHGRGGGEGAWLLSLELLQWQNDRAAFDDRAVDYAVTFEVSPPSWEPPLIAQATAAQGPDTGPAVTAVGETVADDLSAGAEVLTWSGVVAGSHPEQVVKLTAFADGREIVPVNMTQVERIDFVGAGAVYNAIKSIEERQKAVQVFGATPIIRAILLLIGVSPGHFFKKAQ